MWEKRQNQEKKTILSKGCPPPNRLSPRPLPSRNFPLPPLRKRKTKLQMGSPPLLSRFPHPKFWETWAAHEPSRPWLLPAALPPNPETGRSRDTPWLVLFPLGPFKGRPRRGTWKRRPGNIPDDPGHPQPSRASSPRPLRQPDKARQHYELARGYFIEAGKKDMAPS